MSELLADMAREMEELPASPPDGDKMDKLTKLAQQVCTIDDQLAELQRRMDARRERRAQILTRDMVELMDEPGRIVESITVNGRTFLTHTHVQASIKKDAENADQAYDWLERNEAGELINYTVTVSFDKDSVEEARKLERYVRTHFQQAVVEMGRAVHWKRLTSWLKEHLKLSAEEESEGREAPPLELLGAYVGRVVKIKEPKK